MALNDKLTLPPEDNDAFLRSFVCKVTKQLNCLNNTLWNSKLKKLQKGNFLIESTDRTLTAMAGKTKSACKSGCVHCCCQMFKVTSVEIEVISFYLMKNPTILEQFLINYLHRLEGAQLNELQQIYEIYTNGSDGEQRDISVKYFEMKNPCAFLNHQGACMIYKIRPLVCAAFISYDVAECIKSPSGSTTAEMRQLLIQSLNTLKITSKHMDFAADLSTLIFRHLEDVAERGGKAVMI